MSNANAQYQDLLTDPDVAFAVELAKRAGDLLVNRPETLTIETKTSDTDVVTHMDQMAEELIVSAIEIGKPADGLLGEEGAHKISSSGRQWVIDPIDGTINYLYELPHWCVSIGLVEEETRAGLVGVVYAPVLDSLFIGRAGRGSYRVVGSKVARLSVSSESRLGHSLVGTGFGYAADRRAHQASVLTHILPAVRDIRRLGSCALDLCLVASAELDAYFERGVKPWDHAAGSLIVQEAGGIVSDLTGEKPSESMIVAANKQVSPELIAILKAQAADQGV
jgi:myo-inositol-1(or 4)-monophosphatase